MDSLSDLRKLRDLVLRVVDDPVGTQRPHEFHMPRVAYRCHVCAEVFGELDRSRLLTQTNGLRGYAFDPGSTPMIDDLGGALV